MSTKTKEQNTDVAMIDREAEPYQISKLKDLPIAQRALKQAEGIMLLRGLVQHHVPAIQQGLMGSPLGFLTDKDGKGGYPPDVVRDCCVEALLRGVNWTNNEFNIIAGRLYVTVNGYERLVREIPGLTDLAVRNEIPKVMDGGATVTVHAMWKINGSPRNLDAPYAVKLYPGQGADVAIGKARRRLFRDIYRQMTGSIQTDDYDPDELAVGGQKMTGVQAIESRLSNGNGAEKEAPADQSQFEAINALLADLEASEALVEDICQGRGWDFYKLTRSQAIQIIKELQKDLDSARG